MLRCFSTGWAILFICIHQCCLHFTSIVLLQFNQLANLFHALEIDHKRKIKKNVLITIPWNSFPGQRGHLHCKENSSFCVGSRKGRPKKRIWISWSSGGLTVLEVQDQGASWFSFWRELSSWLADGPLFTVSSHGLFFLSGRTEVWLFQIKSFRILQVGWIRDIWKKYKTNPNLWEPLRKPWQRIGTTKQ